MLLSQVFHEIEKKIIPILQKFPILTIEEIQEKTGLESDQVRRGVEWLKLKNLTTVQDIKEIHYHFGKKGDEAISKGLPERRLINAIRNGNNAFENLKKLLGLDFNAAIAHAKKNNWIIFSKINDSTVLKLNETINESPEEKFVKKHHTQQAELQVSSNDDKIIESLKKRPDFITEKVISHQKIALTELGKNLSLQGLDSSYGAIDVEAATPTVYPARIHPLNETIEEIREIFVTLGFSEILGALSQPSFWNFDALFTPQDHPAREMQDTFYLDKIKSKPFATAEQIRKVSSSHKQNWRYQWSIGESQKMVLRTHTTCVTIKYLAENKPDEARVFSLGRVFRNEKVSYKHLVEFNQVEGIVVGKNTTLRDLMGIQKEFYRRIGLTKVKFWPTFFPYTEPSLQTMVYNERLKKWVELFGMGIFRPEVTKPLGINKPVLAWGGGIERIAMMKYGLEDVREFYNNDLKWLRSAAKCP